MPTLQVGSSFSAYWNMKLDILDCAPFLNLFVRQCVNGVDWIPP